MTLALFIHQAGQPMEVHELTPGDDGEIRVGWTLDTIPARAVTVLDAYALCASRPHAPCGSACRTRSRRTAPPSYCGYGATAASGRRSSRMTTDYAHDLAQHGRRLYSCGMTEDLADKLRQAGRLALGEEVVLVPGTEVLGSSLRAAVQEARTWLDRPDTDEER